MLRAAVGTVNPAKVQAVEMVLHNESFHVVAVDVSSDVSAQPFSDEETIQGAINRAVKALKETGADIGFGLEGGVTETEYGMFLLALARSARASRPESATRRLVTALIWQL